MVATPPRICGVGTGGHRHVAQVIERGHPVLRGLRHQRVLQAVFRIQPEGGRDLAAAGQGQQQVVGHIALGDAQLLGAAAIRVHAHFRQIVRLLDAGIDEARDMPQRFQQLIGHVAVLRARADDLDVDGRRDAEVQDLADDVGRQEREGGCPGTRRGRSRRRMRTYFEVGACPGLSEISTSASELPTVPEVL